MASFYKLKSKCNHKKSLIVTAFAIMLISCIPHDASKCVVSKTLEEGGLQRNIYLILFIISKNNPAKTIIIMNFQMITYFCLLNKIYLFLIIKSEKRWPI
jgi:hypothetical protein